MPRSLEGVAAATARAMRGGWGYNRNVSSRFFLSGFNDYEYDRFQNLDLRFVLGGGFGFTPSITPIDAAGNESNTLNTQTDGWNCP